MKNDICRIYDNVLDCKILPMKYILLALRQ